MWAAYKLIYKAISPIHIGWHTLGYIKLTRYYIPGRNIWAAFTENTVHSLQINSEEINNIYIEVGDLFKKDILTSYYYPCIERKNPLLSSFSKEGFKMGNLTKSEFENKFIKSYGQTAIVPESNTKEDESLHESEYISPTIDDDGKIKQVFFIGYVFLRNKKICLQPYKPYNKVIGWDSGDIKLKDAIDELFVGGDRKYGWGRLCLEKSEKIEDGNTIFENENKKKGYKIILDNEKYPIIEINNNNCNIPAHLPFSSSVKLKGDIEPLIGREYEVGKDSNHKNSNRLGSGQKINSFIENDKVFWVPGSSIVTEKSPIKLQIGEYGILREINEK